MRLRVSAAAFLATMVLVAGLPSLGAGQGGGLAFRGNSQVTSTSPGGWDEPSGIAGSDGELYIASQNPNATPDTILSQSADGVHWHDNRAYYTYLANRNEGQMGDVTMAADRARTVFLGHLSKGLQTDIDYTRDDGKTWATANDVAQQPSPGAASSSPFLVDRPWIAVYSPDTNYKDDQVYLEYHDFVTSDVYIVTCKMSTGALQCGSPVTVSNPQTACNSIPSGVAVSPQGSAHPGRVYAVWETADPQTNVSSGCNYTQLAPFYTLYSAYSDTPTDMSSWHQVPIYIGPNGSGENCPGTSPVQGFSTNTCADTSELFTPVAVDGAGNVYVSFVDYIDTLDKHYNLYVARSLDGGTTWDGKSDGSGQPLLVGNAAGTHYTPNVVAGSAGRVAVVYYATSYATSPFEAGDTCPIGAPPETSCQGKNKPEPPSTQWMLDIGESTDATSAQPHFTQVQASDPGVVVHYGDICNLGIYCDGSNTGNRSLFENNTAFTNGAGDLVVGWTDQRLDPKGEDDAAQSDAQNRQVPYDEIFATTQLAGPPLFATPQLPTVPAVPPVKLPPCAQPSGRLRGTRLGPLALGMTRAEARHLFRHFSTRRRRDMDFFCLTPIGIRAGYPSPGVLRSLSPRERKRLRGRVVLLLTADPFYALRGVRPGASLSAARRVLRLTGPFHIGLNYWYIAPAGASRAVLKVRHGIVEEIGLTYGFLTANRRSAFRYLNSFR